MCVVGPAHGPGLRASNVPVLRIRRVALALISAPVTVWEAGWGIDRVRGGCWAVCMRGSGAFVGRERELSRLLGALAGDARMVLVTGDAGMGKTRFVEEGMTRAAAAGMVLVRGECLPVAGTLPLLPVATALGELAGLDGGRLLESALGTAPAFVRTELGRLAAAAGTRRRAGYG